MASVGLFSKISAASPEFNPGTRNAGGSSNNSHIHSPAHSRSNSNISRSNSPYPPVVSGNSNAVAKYTFTYQGQQLEIRNVWAENVEEEMAVIRELVEQKYCYVAMDTEFPGVVAKPVTEQYSPDYHYKSLKVNVDLLKIIQLGLSFADAEGNFAPGCPCWQFNFAFDLDGDMFAQDSIDLLQKSGISFEDHAKRGIDPHLFGELLMVSGLVLDDRVKWVSFHSGYDYGYLLKLLTTQELPSEEKGFFDLLKIYFPTIYDIKYMTSILDGHHFMGGLQRLADDLGCQRLGAEHQAGSDSLLTMSTYFALVKKKFTNAAGKTDDSKYANELFGYGNNHTVRKGANAVLRDQSGGSALSSGSNE
jgi:CCR4-NOT transcription complex subunit 7/8